jgi:hypothetical protein
MDGFRLSAHRVHGGDIEQWNPRLRFLDQSSVGALYERIPSAPVRLLWRLVNATPARNYDVLNRFAF